MKISLFRLFSLCTALTPQVIGATAHELSSHPTGNTHSHAVESPAAPTVNVFIFAGSGERRGTSMGTLRSLLASAAEAMAREAEELRALSAEGRYTIPTSKVDFADSIDLAAVKAKIEAACAADGAFELDFSGKSVSFDWVENFVEMILLPEMKEYLPKIRRLNLSNNLLGVRGLQELIPLLRLDSLETIEVVSNGIESKDIHNFGTAEGDDEEITQEERMILDSSEREKMIKKLIWLPKPYFNPSDANINPSGPYVTPEIIRRHREYFGFSTR